jgi:hypothetical protein
MADGLDVGKRQGIGPRQSLFSRERPLEPRAAVLAHQQQVGEFGGNAGAHLGVFQGLGRMSDHLQVGVPN